MIANLEHRPTAHTTVGRPEPHDTRRHPARHRRKAPRGFRQYVPSSHSRVRVTHPHPPVALDYYRFGTTSRVLLSLTRPEYMRDNLRELEKLTVGGIPVKATPLTVYDDAIPRSRGTRGARAPRRAVLYRARGQRAVSQILSAVLWCGASPGGWSPGSWRARWVAILGLRGRIRGMQLL